MTQIGVNDPRTLWTCCIKVDYSHFSYFYLIIEHADRIAREPDKSTKGRLDMVVVRDQEK